MRWRLEPLHSITSHFVVHLTAFYWRQILQDFGFEVLNSPHYEDYCFWNVTPCSRATVYQYVGGLYCLHLRKQNIVFCPFRTGCLPELFFGIKDGGSMSRTSTRLHGVTCHKTVLFIVITVRTSNPLSCPIVKNPISNQSEYKFRE
jgi:hypothetical protein